MSTINYYLKSPRTSKKAKPEALIMLNYLNNGRKFRFSTKVKVDPKHWKNQRIKVQCNGAAEINALLDSYEAQIREIEREGLFLKKDYNIETIKRKFEKKIGRNTNESDFFSAFNEFIMESHSTKAKNTIKAYVGTRNQLLNYQDFQKEQITFETISVDFYEGFVDYLIKTRKYLNNTIGKHIKTLKTFLNYAKDKDYIHTNVNLKKFKVFNEDIDIIYLSERELLSIYHLPNLSNRLNNVRNLFCFCCFTGLRYSDVSSITFENIKGDYIELRTEKTRDILRIPLNDYAKEILAQYDNTGLCPLPVGISNQKANEYLKEIGKLASLSTSIKIETFSGSNKRTTIKEKWELLGTHTARRTFVTLALEKGIRAEVVMTMTGHKSYRTFKKYIKITDKVMQSEMMRLWSKPLLKVV